MREDGTDELYLAWGKEMYRVTGIIFILCRI